MPVSGSVLPLLAVLAAALLHAGWNALLHVVTDRLVGFAVIGIASVGCCAVAAPFVGLPAGPSRPYLLGSVALHLVYSVLLMAAYRLGDFGQAYPLARGTSPWVVAIIATLVVGEALPPAHLAGVLVVSGGLASLVLAGGVPGRKQLPAVAAAVATGLVIAAYTVVDGVGIRRSGTPLSYITWLFLLEGLVLPLPAVASRGRALLAQLRPVWAAGLLAGVLSLVAYGLVLWAQTRAPLASVAALRETSIIFGAVIGAVLMHERFGRIRLLASIVVFGGIVLLNL